MKPRSDSVGLTLLLGGFMSVLPLALDPTLPALPAIQAAFSATPSDVQLGVSLYLFGVTAGQLFYGPLADRMGRRPVLLAAMIAFTLAAALSAVSTSLGWLVGLRFLQGLAGACGPVLARTIVRDLLANEAGARLMARVTLVFAVATIIGPLVGGVLVSLGGWRAVFVMIALLGCVLSFAAYFMLPETAPAERVPIAPVHVARAFAHLMTRREFLQPTLLAVLSQIGVFAFVTNSALIVIPALGCTPAEYALLFALVMLGHITGVQIGHRRVLRDGIPRMLYLGAVLSALGGLVVVTLSWLHVKGTAAFVAPMALYMIGNGLIMPNASAAALSPFPRLAGSASSLQAMLYLVGGALVGMIVSALLDGTTRPLCTVIGACGVLLLVAERAFHWPRPEISGAIRGHGA